MSTIKVFEELLQSLALNRNKPINLARLVLPLSISAVLLTACAYAPPRLTLIDPEFSLGSKQNIIVATTRQSIEDPQLRYGDKRSDKLGFDEITVWTPLNRKPGSVTYPSRKPNPDREFGITDINRIQNSDFPKILHKRVEKLKGEKLIFVFVHGYNVSYANGIYRHAQLMHDFNAQGVAIHYSWPSAGRTVGYLYDRDSVQFARDGLVEVLSTAAASGADSIFLMGHSMGTLLVMEAVRQLSLSGNNFVLSKISPLVLASPDIDVDVFRSQVLSLSTRPDPIVVFVSKEDSALRISRDIRGGQQRVGIGSNISALQDAGIVVIDLTKLDVGSGTKHGAFASSPPLINALQKVNVARATQSSTLREGGDRLGPVKELRDLTDGIVHLPTEITSQE